MVAALAAAHPTPLPSSRLAELIWGDAQPASAVKSIHNHVSRLKRSADGLVDSHPDGYRLGPDVVVDLTSGEPTDHLLADLPDTPEVLELRAQLRVAATDADEVALAASADVEPTPDLVERLRRAVEDEPFREHRWSLLASAQMRLGRRREALLTLADARRQLAEVGLTPGPDLVDLESTILAADPTPAAGTLRPAPPIHPHRNDPFVGRETELDRLGTVWDETCTLGGPRMVVVRGQAGIGKTRLVDEFCRRAGVDDPDVRVLWGRHRPDTGRALGAITEAVERAVAHDPTLVPADDPLRILLGDHAPEPGLAADLVRTRVGRSLSQLVERLSDRPTIWLFDDLQWASADSVVLLQEAIDGASAPLLIVGTSRPDDGDGAGRWGEVARSIGIVDIALEPLERGDVARLVTERTDLPVDERGAEALHLRTGGLPLYASELARAASATGRLEIDEVPAPIREWLHHRIATLDDDAVAVLRSAAVSGQSVELPVVATVCDLTVDDAATRLDQLAQRGFLDVDTAANVSFSHALTRDIVEESIGPLVRLRLHVATAEALGVSRPDEHARIARHFDAAGDARAHGHASLAGERSLPVGAWSHATECFTIAARHAVAPAETIRANVGLGRALLGAGRADDASAALLEAAALADEHDDVVMHARAALTLVGRAGRGALAHDEAAQFDVLRRALDHIERTASRDDRVLEPLRSDLERELAFLMLLTGPKVERDRLLRSALDRAERLTPPDPNTHARALLGYRYAQLGPNDLPGRLADLDRVAALPAKAVTPEVRISTELYRCDDLVRANRHVEAAEALDRATALLADYPDPYWAWTVETWRGLLYLVAGDLEQADAVSAHAVGLREAFVEAHVCRAVNQVAIALYAGTVGGMIDLLTAAVDASPNIPTFRAVLSLCAAEAGDDRLAARHLRWFVDERVENLPDDPNRFLGLGVLAHTASMLNDVEAAEALFPLLRPYDGQWVSLSCYGGGGASWGPVSHGLGALATTLERDDAAEYLQRAALEAAHAPLARDRVDRNRSRLDAA